MAWEPLGWKAAWYSQFDPDHNYKSGPDFASAVLAHRWPDVPNLGDMTRIHDNETFKKEEINILVGGTPCQPFSLSGKRRGLDDPKGELALAFCRIAKEKQPPWVVWENVPGVLSSGGGRDFALFLRGLEELGYSLAYRVLDAQYFGVPQRRRRVFVVGHRGDNFAEYVLFDGEGGSWNPAPSQKAPPLKEVPPPEGVAEESGEQIISFNHQEGRNFAQREVSNPLIRSQTQAVLVPGQEPRKFTPVECERLQGFPDDYTLVPYRGNAAAECPDSPRYKALGNSVAVPVLRWIGERIEEIDSLVEGTSQHVSARPDPERLAKTMDDDELLFRCEEGFRDLREVVPYLREARDRFAQPGRRVPVPGNPTWTEWVEANPSRHRAARAAVARGTPRNDFARFQAEITQPAGRGLAKPDESNGAQDSTGIRSHSGR